MKYEQLFVDVKNRVIQDLGDNFSMSLFDDLTLSLNYKKRSRLNSNDQYRSRAAKIPAYYNPNTHSVHLNINVLENAADDLVENIYYHELVHAGSHHAKMSHDGLKILKSGLKIQMWDENDRPTTLHRGLNEGFTQYLANTYTHGGSAYRREVEIVGRLIQRIGIAPLKEAYFGPGINVLEKKMAMTLGANVLNQLSALVDAKEYDDAAALLR